MKILVKILGFLNGGYMLLDGIYVMLKGKYIGPEKPVPWANLFYKFKIDIFSLGPLFIAFGLLWLFWLYCLWTNQSWTYVLGIVIRIFDSLVFVRWDNFFSEYSFDLSIC